MYCSAQSIKLALMFIVSVETLCFLILSTSQHGDFTGVSSYLMIWMLIGQKVVHIIKLVESAL